MLLQYAGVDWLTMTSRDERTGNNWWSTYVKYRKARAAEANVEKPFSNGFYSGVRIASMQWGYSDSIGYIVIVSGADAELMFQRFQPARHKATRIDICVDFSFREPVDVAGDIYRGLQERTSNTQRLHSLFVNSRGGATAYIGSRHSQQFGRVYDKGVQSGREKPGHLWRAEVEYKKPLAGQISAALSSVDPVERQRQITNEVHRWYADREAALPYELLPGEVFDISVQQRITTARKKLAWLRQQVAPTVAQLIEAGYGREVRASLLLDEKALNRMLVSES